MIWADDLVERLKLLWPSHSASEIAFMFGEEGYPVTRNAVIGKAHRLDLDSKPPKPAQPRGPRSLRRTQFRPPAVQPIGSPTLSPAPFVPRVVENGPPLHLTLLQLTDAICKYEVSKQHDPALFTFCGRSVSTGRYCAAHAAICFEQRVPKAKNKPFWREAV